MLYRYLQREGGGLEVEGRERGRPAALPVVQEDNPGTGTSALCYRTCIQREEREERRERERDTSAICRASHRIVSYIWCAV